MDDIPSIWGIFYQTNIKLIISDDPQAVSHKSDPIETSSVHTPNQAGQYVVSNMEQVSAAAVDSINMMKANSHNPQTLTPSASATQDLS